jgi:hypothetical protein
MTVVENRPTITLVGGVTGRGFSRGTSGNPGGRPKGLARRVREAVGNDGKQIAEFLLSVMNDPRQRTRDRLEAARLLADRGWGKPVVSVDLDVGLEPRQLVADAQRFEELSTEELDVVIGLAERSYLALNAAS